MHCPPDAKLSLCPPRSECDCPASSEVKQWPWQRALVFSPRLYRAMAAPTAPSSSSSTSCHGEPNPNTANLRPPASSRCIIHIKRFCTPAICFGAAAVNLGGEVEGKWRGRGGDDEGETAPIGHRLRCSKSHPDSVSELKAHTGDN